MPCRTPRKDLRDAREVVIKRNNMSGKDAVIFHLLNYLIILCVTVTNGYVARNCLKGAKGLNHREAAIMI